MTYYVTWYESEKGILIEEVLEENGIDYDLISTPAFLRDIDVMICNDCIQVNEKTNVLKDIEGLFPLDTQIFEGEENRKWQFEKKIS